MPAHARRLPDDSKAADKVDHAEASRRAKSVLDLYKELWQLHCYRDLNFTGFKKIMKKFDKNAGEKQSGEVMERMKQEEFYKNKELEPCIAEVESLYTRIAIVHEQDLLAAQQQLKRVRNDVVSVKVKI